ncbi:MAG: response regulator [Burkholderiales bacterium]|nr:response regulator [Burkholderiales bacterium]
MADRGHALSARAPPARLSWLGMVGFGLMLALLAVALVQARQFSLLRQALVSGDDFGTLTIFQAETEYLRLRDRWHHELDDQTAPDPAALRLRYAIWISRVQALHAERTRGLLDDEAEYRATLDQIDQFVGNTQAALGPQPTQSADRDFLVALQPALEALGTPLHELSQGAAQRAATLLEQRANTVRAQNQLGLGLTIFLSVLTLAFAAIALHQVRQLRERRVALEGLADNLRQARRDAEAASEAKSAFLANMSHEIRTPFHGMMGMLSLLRETGLTPRQIDYLRTATESADHLLALLNDILDMSQLESGRVTLAPAAVELRTLLRDVEALMRPQAGAKSLALHIDADPAVPERVLLDATRVKQIVFNLLSNAIKFSDRGAVVLDVRCAPGSRELAFVVTDNGVGMDEATLAHLFNRFMQGDSSRSRRHGGSGLGLEISRNLARLMGGDITVRSKAGEGSVFTFTMPLRIPPAPAAAAGARPLVGEPMPRLRVLVAEDHPVNRQYIAALLESLGHEAHFSEDGEQAVRSAREQPYDLVLMDLHMPGLDGVQATRAIRALPDPAQSTVPIVALTADAFEETRERCLVAGMNDFLTKPVSPQKLQTSLRRLFGAAIAPAPEPATAQPRPWDGQAQTLVDEGAIRMALEAMPAERLGGMIESFLDQGAETVERLRAAVRNGQPLDLRVNAHAAKGAALNLGLAGLAATATALQEGASHLPAVEIARLVQRYESQLPLTRQAVRALHIPGILWPLATSH